MSKNALKLKEQSMESGQKTLEEAFDAGKMYQAAKEIKEKVLSVTKRAKRFMVNLFRTLFDSYLTILLGFTSGCNFIGFPNWGKFTWGKNLRSDTSLV